MRRSSSPRGGPDPDGRRSFLRKAGLGSVGAFALAGLGDVLASPAANASQRSARAKTKGHMTIMKKGAQTDERCTAVAVCHPCSGCCPGGPCTPSGVAYCFYCTATPCQGAGVACYDHAPEEFTICCNT
jgi:hypothetical protein